MKLKQALVLGLTTAVLAIPAFAADEATDAINQPAATAEQKAAVITPAKKDALNKKGQKDSLEAKKAEKQTDLSKLSTVNPSDETEAK
jgi:hypothetical protein